MSRRWPVVLSLGSAQTLSWASSYYLCAIVAQPMADSLAVPVAAILGAFSAALIVSALLGPWAGRYIDRHGGRNLLLASHGVMATALTLMAASPSAWVLGAAWMVLGVGMGIGLYEASFASLVRLWGHAARNPITGITLLAGLASTVGWPVSAWVTATWGWREACLVWAALHLVVGLPLTARLPPWRPDSASATPGPPPMATGAPEEVPAAEFAEGVPAPPRWAAWALAWVFAATWFNSTALATHFPQLLLAAGVALPVAIAAGALIGPAQVAGRLLEFGFLRRWHPLWSARAAAFMHPAGALVFGLLGVPAAYALALLHGLGNGVLTISKGTLPLALYGPHGYGARQGVIMAPSRVAQAAAPLAFGWCVEHLGAHSLWITSALAFSAIACLLALRTNATKDKRVSSFLS